MFFGPMFRREFLAPTRGRRPYWLRFLVAGGLGVVALAVAAVVWLDLIPTSDRVGQFGRGLFVASAAFEVAVMLLLFPRYAGGAISEERATGTLPLLLLTRLRPSEIVLTKFAGRWLAAVDPLLVGLPFVLASGWLGGLVGEIGWVVGGLSSCSLFMASMAIYASSPRGQKATGMSMAGVYLFGWIFVAPAVAAIPVLTVNLWGKALDLIKSAASVVAPSSPLSLLLDPSWVGKSGLDGLPGRMAWMIGLQAAFGLVALIRAVDGLEVLEKDPKASDSLTRDRPRVGDDPLFWREYELANPRGIWSDFTQALRLAWRSLRGVLLHLFLLAASLLTLAVPIGIFAALAYYGGPAFAELWRNGYGSGPFAARGAFNGYLRMATAILSFGPLLSMGPMISARVELARQQKTWDELLTTPLGGDEILRSKGKAALLGSWQSTWPLPILWAIGIACGVLTAPGVLLAGVTLALSAWFSLGLGLVLAIRPATPGARAGLGTSGMMASIVLHLSLVVAALASPGEVAAAREWDPGLRWALILAALAILAATALAARALTRLAFARFDVWVGRPHKADPAA